MKDHIHLCLSIPLQYAVSAAIGLLKGKIASEVMSFGSRTKKMVRGRQFWARGYCVSTAGLDEHTVREYMVNTICPDIDDVIVYRLITPLFKLLFPLGLELDDGGWG